MVESLRSQNLFNQRVGHGLTSFCMQCKLFQNLRLHEPVFVDLRGELNEVSQHAGTRESGVANLRQEAVQTVSKFVEQSSGIVQTEKGCLTFGPL